MTMMMMKLEKPKGRKEKNEKREAERLSYLIERGKGFDQTV